MRSVSVAIASTGRRSLLRTLASLDALEIPPGTAVDVVIADDDPGGAAGRLVAQHAPSSVLVRVARGKQFGLHHARNTLLDAITADWIAFVDDDEWVEPDWLIRLFACHDDFAADAVFGPVYPVYSDGAPDHFERAGAHFADWGKRGRIVETGRCGNALVRRSIIAAANLRFDGAFATTGGEDTEFFYLYGRAGGRMVVTDDAVAYEHVPDDRATTAYVLKRALRTGQSYARYVLKRNKSGPLGAALFSADAAVKAIAAVAAAGLLWPFDKSLGLRFARKAWSNAGKIREALGMRMPEMYGPPQGRQPP